MKPEDRMSSRDELEALLPFYLNGTLDEVDLAAIEEWLATDPEAVAALEAAELEFAGTAEANEAIRPPAEALARFSAALDAEAGQTAAVDVPSILARFWAGFWAIPASVAWATAAAAVALVLVQTVLGPGGSQEPVEIAGSGQGGDLPFVLVTFKSEAKLADVSAFLAEQRASILSGPAPGGIYKIAIPAETAADYDRIIGLIAAQPFADTVLTGRKPGNGG